MGKNTARKSALDWIGEENISFNGEKMKIINVNLSDGTIDVQFEDGTIVRNKTHCEFVFHMVGKYENKLESVENPSETIKGVKLIRYGSPTDVDVQLDDGTIIKHLWYIDFLSGDAERKRLWKNSEGEYIYGPSRANTRPDLVGEMSTTTWGGKMTLIRYGSENDVDVQFENGDIYYSANYSDFRNGTLEHPINLLNDERLDEMKMANCGLMMRIIRFEKRDDISVQFEDGRIVCHRTYNAFKKGSIGHPRIRTKRKSKTA